jgi:hypothetical protein
MANSINIFTKMLQDNKAHGCAYCQQWNESSQKCEPIPDCGRMGPVLKYGIPKTTSTTTTTTTIAPTTTNNTTKYLLYVALGIIALMIFKKKK